MRVIIIGAGIGGLAAAAALRRVGIETINVERVPAIREVGAGLSLWSNAVNALKQLRVADKVLASASAVERVISRTAAGRPITVNPIGEISRDAGAPSVCIHRAVLHRLLFEELSPEAVRTGANCTGFEGATAILENGERIAADVLVGADGISSVIREILHGTRPPRYAGYTCWRGILRAEGVLPERAAYMVTAAGAQLGAWPCGPGQVYWFLTKNAPQGTKQTKANALAFCRGWVAPVPALIEGTSEEAIVQNDILDRPPIAQWGRGPVTLLGDAGHATTPTLGQGACQALEDAVVLADCLHRIQPVDAALREYERCRIPRTTEVVRVSWRSGRIMQIDQPALESLRNWFWGTSLGRRFGTRMFHKLLTYQVPTL